MYLCTTNTQFSNSVILSFGFIFLAQMTSYIFLNKNVYNVSVYLSDMYIVPLVSLDSVTFIDLEYGGPNFRGFDLGDFFCGFAGN